MKIISQILPKIGCLATYLKESEKRSGSINSRKYLLYGEKIMKTGPADPVIIWLKIKK